MNDKRKDLLKEADLPIAGDLTDKQKDIIQASLTLFADKGYAGTRTQAIAQKAKVSEKTLFKHFGSKEALFKQTIYPVLLQVLAPIVKERTDDLIRQVHSDDSSELLEALFRDRVRFAVENPDMVKLILQELLLNPDFREVGGAFWKEQSQSIPLIAGAFPAGDKASQSAIIRIVLSMLVGYIVTRTIFAPDREWNDKKEIAFMLDILRHGIKEQLKKDSE